MTAQWPRPECELYELAEQALRVAELVLEQRIRWQEGREQNASIAFNNINFVIRSQPGPDAVSEALEASELAAANARWAAVERAHAEHAVKAAKALVETARALDGHLKWVCR